MPGLRFINHEKISFANNSAFCFGLRNSGFDRRSTADLCVALVSCLGDVPGAWFGFVCTRTAVVRVDLHPGERTLWQSPCACVVVHTNWDIPVLRTETRERRFLSFALSCCAVLDGHCLCGDWLRRMDNGLPERCKCHPGNVFSAHNIMSGGLRRIAELDMEEDILQLKKVNFLLTFRCKYVIIKIVGYWNC